MFLPRPDPNNEPRTPFDFFSLLIPTTFYTEIAEQTNLFARQRGADETTFTPTNADEIRAFIGLYMYMNIHVLPSLKLYWSEKSPFYASYVTKTIPRKRFEKLSKYTCIWTTERRRLTRADKGTTRCTQGAPDHLDDTTNLRRALHHFYIQSFSLTICIVIVGV